MPQARGWCMLAVLIAWRAVGPAPLFGQEATERERAQVAAQLSRQIVLHRAKQLVLGEAYERAAKHVEIEPTAIVAAGGRLTWQLQPRHKLTGDQQVAALLHVEKWLAAALTAPEGGQPLDAKRAATLVAESNLSLAAPPTRISPLQLDQVEESKIRQAIVDYVAQQAGKGRFAGREFDNLRRYARLNPPQVGEMVLCERGAITCIFGLTDEWAKTWEERFNLRNPPSGDFYANRRVSVSPFAAVVRESLYLQNFGDTGQPLLSREDALAVQVEIVSEMSFGDFAPGARQAMPTMSRGAANRTVRQFATFSPQRFPQVSLHNERQYVDPADEPEFLGPAAPTLVIDQQGFSGAMVSALAFSPDGSRLAAVGDVLRIWDVTTGSLLQTVRCVPAANNRGLTDVAWSPDGRYLAVSVAGTRETIRIYETADFTQVKDVLAGHKGFVDRLEFSPDGKWLVTAGSDQRIYVWDWPTRTTVRAITANSRIDLIAFPDSSANFVVIDAAGNSAFVSAETVNPAPVNTSPAVQRLLARLAWPDGGQAHPYTVAFSGAARRLAIGGWSRTAEGDRFWCGLWSGDSAAPVQQIRRRYFVTACDLSPSGDKLASADGTGAIVISDAASGQELRRFAPLGRPIYSVEQADDGGLLIGRVPKPASEWNRNSYARLDQRLAVLQRSFGRLDPPREPRPALLEAEGRRLRYVGGNPPRLEFRGEDGTAQSLPLNATSRFDALCYCLLRTNSLQSVEPFDSTEIGARNPAAIGLESGELFALNPRSLLPVRGFAGHIDRVWSLAEGDGGRTLFSSSGDGTVRAWPLTDPRLGGNLACYVDDAGRVSFVVPGTPTARAGIRDGDRVLFVDQRSLADLGKELRSGQWRLKPGEVVPVTIERDGQQHELEVELSNTGDLVQPLYSLFVTPDGKDWVIWTPQGYYDASPNAETWVGWELDNGETQPAKFAPLEQFRQKFHRPDLIDALITTGKLPEGTDLPLAPPKPDENGLVFGPPTPPILSSPPQVSILEPAGAMVTGQREVYVRAAITMRGEDVATFGRPDVKVLVNGIPAPQPRGAVMVEDDALAAAPVHDFEKTDSETGEYVRRIRWPVFLDPGQNTIAVVATTRTAQNNPAQNSVQVVYRERDESKPALHILAIGVSEYQDQGIADLKFAHRDAEEFAAAIKRHAGPLHGRVAEPVVLINEMATSGAIQDAMDQLVKDARPKSTIAIFVASHGVLDGRGNYYVVTHETDRTRLRSTAVAWSDFEQTIKDLAGCRLMFFADTCHSAALELAVDRDFLNLRELSGEDRGVFVFASCCARQRSYEPAELGHGLFTKAILDTLAQDGISSDRSPIPPDGKLSLDEFKLVVGERMVALRERIKLTAPQDLNYMQSQMSKDFQVFELTAGGGGD